jgi:hypothetical protein
LETESDLDEVWVAAIVVVSEVSYSDRPATTPLSNVEAMFAAPKTEVRTSVKLIGAAVSEENARSMLADWRQANPGIQGEETVALVPMWSNDVTPPPRPPPPPQPTCVDCGTAIPRGLRCGGCTKKHWAACNAADPMKDVEEA